MVARDWMMAGGRFNQQCSDFKASQKTGPRLYVSSDRLGEAAGIEPEAEAPWFTRHRYQIRNSLVCGHVPWLKPVLAGWVYGFSGASYAQPAVVLVLKRLRRRGHSFKSHPTDWEKPGIESATPGLQGIG